MDKQEKLKLKTQKSFGYQWTNFSEMSCDFKDNFLNYIYPLKEDFFKGKRGLDAGCGFGRHLYNATLFGAKMVGMDFSDAIESSRKNTKALKDVHLVRADICNPPFLEETFDFVYSIGVLHHLPDPEKGFNSLLRYIKNRGSIFIWVYSKKRRLTNFLLEGARLFTSRLPMKILKGLSFVCALIDWLVFILPYKILSNIPVVKHAALKISLKRVQVYAQYPFQVCFTDWFDRLSAPIRFYYDEHELMQWAKRADLINIIISPTGNYGWRLYGEKK